MDATRAQAISLLVFFVALGVAVAIILLWDLWVYRRYGSPGTVTVGVRTLTRSFPIIAFLMGLFIGIVAGHFWWCK